MKRTRRFNILALSLLILGALVASGTVSAHDGQSGDDRGSGTVMAMESESTVPDEVKAELHKRAEEHVNELRQEHKSQSAENRQKACVAHKQGLTKKFERIVANAERHQARIDGALDKGVAFKDSNNLSPDNYDTLLTAAQDAKTKSAASIEALKAVEPTLDCNNVSVASDVATFKAAAQTVRTDLKAYKTAVKNLLKAIRDAKQAASESTDTTEGSTE